MTVADAKWLSDRLKDAPEAKNQIAFADVIILNKIDLVTPEELDEVEARIRAINPYARSTAPQNCAVPIAEVLEPQRLRPRPHHRARAGLLGGRRHDHDHDHHHDHADHPCRPEALSRRDMQSVSIRRRGRPGKVHALAVELTQREGPNILRCKGIVAFKNEPKRFVFQGVHMMLDGDVQREWKADEKRESRVVFIGRDLDEAAIRDGFLACAA